MATLLAIRRIIPVEDALVPRRKAVLGPASRLRNESLARMLGELQLGGWSLSPATIDFLERTILEHQPGLVLEFGSGVSTVCLASLQRQIVGDGDSLLLVSIDEDDERARETSSRLEELGLARNARVFAAPLVNQPVEGRVERCYCLPALELETVFAGRRADLVVVDGPSLPSGGSRFATLPLARDLVAAGAIVLLDDARRDSELAVARRWRRLPWLELRGVHLVGKGILEARIRRLREVDPVAKAST